MADFSQGHSQSQKHKFSHRLTPNVRLVQETSHAHIHQIEQRIDNEQCQNIALEIDDESSMPEDTEPEEKDDDYNEDFDKPDGEYETGDNSPSFDYDEIGYSDIPTNLEQAAIQRFAGQSDQLEYALQCIDHYRIHGHFPEATDPILYQYLVELEKSIMYQNTPSAYPTFEVVVDGDNVEANAVPVGLNLKYVKGLGSTSTNAKNFIKFLHERNRLLNDLAYYILKIIQGNFFRQHNFDTALQHLLPVPIKKLSTLPIDFPFKIDKKYLSKLGDHLVSCSFGTFPFNFFLQKKAQIVRLWVHFAKKNKKFTSNEQLFWIRNQIENTIESLDVNDVRYGFASPLLDITIDDIKYAKRIQSNA